MDVLSAPWHSRWMPKRASLCRFLTVLTLSQALVIKALLLGWSGALAASQPGGLNAICVAGGPLRSNNGDTAPAPPPAHHDCASACIAGPGAEPPRLTVLARQQPDFVQVTLPAEAVWLPMSETCAFSARAPPATI